MIEIKKLDNRQQLTVFSENGLINTIDGKYVSAEVHNGHDESNDYVDITIDTIVHKKSLKFLIDVFQDFYEQMT